MQSSCDSRVRSMIKSRFRGSSLVSSVTRFAINKCMQFPVLYANLFPMKFSDEKNEKFQIYFSVELPNSKTTTTQLMTSS